MNVIGTHATLDVVGMHATTLGAMANYTGIGIGANASLLGGHPWIPGACRATPLEIPAAASPTPARLRAPPPTAVGEPTKRRRIDGKGSGAGDANGDHDPEANLSRWEVAGGCGLLSNR